MYDWVAQLYYFHSQWYISFLQKYGNYLSFTSVYSTHSVIFALIC